MEDWIGPEQRTFSEEDIRLAQKYLRARGNRQHIQRSYEKAGALSSGLIEGFYAWRLSKKLGLEFSPLDEQMIPLEAVANGICISYYSSRTPTPFEF